jgi:hypothetical protein
VEGKWKESGRKVEGKWKESGIPDQKGVLDMIRGLPDDYLFPGNNKIWHGTVAWHFCFFRMVRMCGLHRGSTVLCHHREMPRGGIGGQTHVPFIILPVLAKKKEFSIY